VDRPVRIHTAQRLRVVGQAGRFSRSNSGNGRSEEDWQSEFLPGSGAARPLQLHTQHIRAVRSSRRTFEAEAEVLTGIAIPGRADRPDNEMEPDNSWWHSLVGARWEALPARYKVVFATSVAFMLCNMVRLPLLICSGRALRHVSGTFRKLESCAVWLAFDLFPSLRC
jgi:hypothetical protein